MHNGYNLTGSDIPMSEYLDKNTFIWFKYRNFWTLLNINKCVLTWEHSHFFFANNCFWLLIFGDLSGYSIRYWCAELYMLFRKVKDQILEPKCFEKCFNVLKSQRPRILKQFFKMQALFDSCFTFYCLRWSDILGCNQSILHSIFHFLFLPRWYQ